MTASASPRQDESDLDREASEQESGPTRHEGPPDAGECERPVAHSGFPLEDGMRWTRLIMASAIAAATEAARTTLSDVTGLPLAVPVLASDASRIDWNPVPGAAEYLCRVYSGGLLQLEASDTAPGCGLPALPPGAYKASILALSTNLGGVAGPGARDKILKWEAQNAAKLRDQGQLRDPTKHTRP